MNLFRKKSIDSILKTSADDSHHGSLAKHLGVKDLTAFGIAAIIGAGIFLQLVRPAQMEVPELSSFYFYRSGL